MKTTRFCGTISGNGKYLIVGEKSTYTKDPDASSGNSGKYVYNGVDYTNEFDPVYYSNKYPDLKEAFGTDAELLLQHWATFGKREGRKAKA